MIGAGFQLRAAGRQGGGAAHYSVHKTKRVDKRCGKRIGLLAARVFTGM